MSGDGVVSFESAALPGVIVHVDSRGATGTNGTTVIGGNGTVTRVNVTAVIDGGGDGAAPGVAATVEVPEAAVSVLKEGALEATVGADKVDVPLTSAEEAGGLTAVL